jgi:hypothetical protein
MRLVKKSILKKTFIYPLYLGLKNISPRKNEIRGNKLEIIRLDKLRGSLVDKYIPKGGIGAELGVLKGNFSKVLLNRTKPKELHLIDPWYFLTSKWDWTGGNQSTVDALCYILQSNKKEIDEKKVFVHVQDDIKLLGEFPDEYFDWVYLDSSHEYEHTVAELELLHKKVKSSGIICGDDWRPDANHIHHGVYRAVNEFILKYNYDLIYSDDNNLQWFIKENSIE